MLNIDRYGNLWTVHRCKSDKCRMVLTQIFDGASLTTNRIRRFDAGGSSPFHSEVHSLYYRCIGLFRHLRLSFGQKALVRDILMNMRHIVPTTISDRYGKVTELQGCTSHIALSHACPPDSFPVPSILITAIQIVDTSQQATLFTHNINMHGPTKTHRLHITAPRCNRLIL